MMPSKIIKYIINYFNNIKKWRELREDDRTLITTCLFKKKILQ